MGLSPSVPLLFRRPPRGRRKSVLRRLAVAVRRSLSSAVLRTWSSSPRLRPPRGLRKSILFSSSASLSREVKMLAIAIATAALLAFSATAEAAITKYDYGGRESYKNEDYDSYDLHGAYGSDYMRRYDHGHEAYEAEDYHNDPFYESHFADRDYRDPHHDSYDEDHYSGDAYFEEPSFAYAKRYKRSQAPVQALLARYKRRDGLFRRRHAVARATFTEQGISGTIRFEQWHPSHAVWTCIKLSGLGGKAGMYHVHEFAVKDNNCSSTGGHFNPLNVDQGQHGQGHHMHEVGDLSGKHGGLEGKDEVSECFWDTNLSLFGKHSIVNRSIVIHKNPGGDRWVCADILLVG